MDGSTAKFASTLEQFEWTDCQQQYIKLADGVNEPASS